MMQKQPYKQVDLWSTVEMNRHSMPLKINADQQELLQGWIRAHGTPQQVAKRCHIVLLAHQGHSDVLIAQQLGLSRHTCRLWRQRFVLEGAHSLWEVAKGRGRKPQEGLAQRIIEATLHSKPKVVPCPERAENK
jgi:hypothetical protein